MSLRWADAFGMDLLLMTLERRLRVDNSSSESGLTLSGERRPPSAYSHGTIRLPLDAVGQGWDRNRRSTGLGCSGRDGFRPETSTGDAFRTGLKDFYWTESSLTFQILRVGEGALSRCRESAESDTSDGFGGITTVMLASVCVLRTSNLDAGISVIAPPEPSVAHEPADPRKSIA